MKQRKPNSIQCHRSHRPERSLKSISEFLIACLSVIRIWFMNASSTINSGIEHVRQHFWQLLRGVGYFIPAFFAVDFTRIHPKVILFLIMTLAITLKNNVTLKNVRNIVNRTYPCLLASRLNGCARVFTGKMYYSSWDWLYEVS